MGSNTGGGSAARRKAQGAALPTFPFVEKLLPRADDMRGTYKLYEPDVNLKESPMLKHTLILPDKAADGALAARLLQDAIDALDVVLMLVFGRDDPAEQVVNWADQLCNKTQIGDSNLRRVVWIRNPEAKEVAAILAGMLKGDLPRVAVLDFHDQVKTTLLDSSGIDPIALEKAFLEGQAL